MNEKLAKTDEPFAIPKDCGGTTAVEVVGDANDHGHREPMLTTCAWEEFARDPGYKIDQDETNLQRHNPGMENTMHEFKHGTLHSGSKKGPVVKSRAQAIAIGMSEDRAKG